MKEGGSRCPQASNQASDKQREIGQSLPSTADSGAQTRPRGRPEVARAKSPCESLPETGDSEIGAPLPYKSTRRRSKHGPGALGNGLLAP